MFEFRILTEKDDMRQQQELMRYAFEPKQSNYDGIKIEDYDKYYQNVLFYGLFA